MTTILITGLDLRFSWLVAAALAAQPGTRVIGVASAPCAAPDGVAFFRCDDADALRATLAETGAETVLHLDQPAEEGQRRGGVARSVELLAACSATGVRRIVIRSSALVYGPLAGLPLFVPETQPIAQQMSGGALADYVEVERIATEFAARHPAIELALLRCAALVGAGISSPLLRYLEQRTPPVVAGFNPRVQLLPARDAAVAFAVAALADGVRGPINLGCAAPLTLRQAIGLAGGASIPLPAALLSAGGGASPLGAGRVGAAWVDASAMRYGCVADVALARSALGWSSDVTDSAAALRSALAERV